MGTYDIIERAHFFVCFLIKRGLSMVSLKTLFEPSKWVRALRAGTFFFLIIPQKTHTLEPITAVTVVSYTVAATAFSLLWKGKEFFNWWNSNQTSQTNTGHPIFNPNCPQCVQERALKLEQKLSQAPETSASQVIIHHTTHNTNITAGEGNTINVLPPGSEVPIQPPSPTQTIQAIQKSESPVQPTIQTKAIYSVPEFYRNNYGKATIVVAITGYLYVLYLVSSLQRYLTDPKRISLWFSEYDLNKLVLLEPEHMKELIIQEFINIYQVSDQKSLKNGVLRFLNDMELELKNLARYERISGIINSLSLITENCCSPFCYLARTALPAAGLILDIVPSFSINNLFFINNKLKIAIQERISRIHYYKNIFLQTTIVV